MDARTIQRVEKRHDASLATLQALAAAFECEVADILDSEPQLQNLASEPATEENSETNKREVRFLHRLANGKDLFDVTGGAELFQWEYDRTETSEETNIIGEFLELVQDTSEIWNDIPIQSRLEYAFDGNSWIKKTEDSGFLVFGIRRKVLYSGIPMDMATLLLKRSNDPRLLRIEDVAVAVPAIIADDEQICAKN